MNYETTLQRVNYLIGRHNLPDYRTPAAKMTVIPRQELPVERMGWASSDYAKWICDGKPKPDMKHITYEDGGYYIRRRDPATGNPFIKALGTNNYFEALALRDSIMGSASTN